MGSSKFQNARELLVLAMSLIFSVSALAAAASNPTESVKGRKPVIAGAAIDYADADANGRVNAGDTLSANEGVFSDQDGDVGIASLFSWKSDGVEVGTASTYQVSIGDNGKKITLSVTPRTDEAITDPAKGDVVLASGGTADIDGNGQIEIPANGEVVSVSITGLVGGFPQVGTTLTAVPTCEGGTCGAVSYKWELETAIGSGLYNSISGANGDTYTPVGGDQKRKIRVVAGN